MNINSLDAAIADEILPTTTINLLTYIPNHAFLGRDSVGYLTSIIKDLTASARNGGAESDEVKVLDFMPDLLARHVHAEGGLTFGDFLDMVELAGIDIKDAERQKYTKQRLFSMFEAALAYQDKTKRYVS